MSKAGPADQPATTDYTCSPAIQEIPGPAGAEDNKNDWYLGFFQLHPGNEWSHVHLSAELFQCRRYKWQPAVYLPAGDM